MRALLVAIVLASPAALAQSTIVDLDKPGALEALAKSNPEHYRAVMERARAVGGETCESAARVYRTRPDQRDAVCRSRQLRTSYPAQTLEQIRIDNVAYQVTVYLDPSKYKISRGR